MKRTKSCTVWRRASTAAHRTSHLLILLLVGAACAAVFAATLVPAAQAATAALGQAKHSSPFAVDLGRVPSNPRLTTGPTPPPNVVFKDASAVGGVGEVVIPGVPAYLWRCGCAPTAVAMIVGYYDGQGYDLLVPGSAATVTAATEQLIASQGHWDDYWLPNETDPNVVVPDKSELPAGDEHASDSVADFMRASWSVDGLVAGESFVGSGEEGLIGYVHSKYAALSVSATTLLGSDFSWEMYKAEIDAGRPVLLEVDCGGDGWPDHAVAAFGYREVNGYPEYVCWDTWSAVLRRWQQFRPMSSSYSWGVLGGTTYRIGGTTPTADTTPPVTTVAGADDAWHRTSVTLTFSASDASSGVAYTEYALDGGTWTRGSTLSLTLGRRAGNSGVHTVTYRSVDLAGNLESERYAYVKLDGKPPLTTSNADGSSHQGSFTLVLTPTDAHSGVAATYYALDGKGYKAGTSVQINGQGTHAVTFYSVDVAGNGEVWKSVMIVIT
jgi:hypothetical protein